MMIIDARDEKDTVARRNNEAGFGETVVPSQDTA